MKPGNPKTLEKIIAENREKFLVDPDNNHMDRFMVKLSIRIRHFISIVPYLVKVGIVTLLIFVFSFLVWNNFIRKDPHYIILRYKTINLINKII
ncbi:MAG TPA: hypothetical protein VHO68_11935 [Bacteroidales bacterium]|nr:hypothetical protein [Bacteroidales bacterium]